MSKSNPTENRAFANRGAICMFIFSGHRACAVFPSPKNRDRDVTGEMT